MKKIIATALVCLLSSPAFSASPVGAWLVVTNIPGMQIAKTVNDSNSVAGVICFTDDSTCSAYVGADITCEEKASYPMMVNATTGSYMLSTTCLTIQKVQYLVITEFDTAVSAFESGGEIGFAIPMADGKFRVVRFNCSGATTAIRLARTMPAPTKKATTENRSL